MIQISPPLIAGQTEFDEMTGILGDVLTEAWSRYTASGAPGRAPAASPDRFAQRAARVAVSEKPCPGSDPGRGLRGHVDGSRAQ